LVADVNAKSGSSSVTDGQSWISQDPKDPDWYLFVSVGNEDDLSGGFAKKVGESWQDVATASLSGDWGCQRGVPSKVVLAFGVGVCPSSPSNSNTTTTTVPPIDSSPAAGPPESTVGDGGAWSTAPQSLVAAMNAYSKMQETEHGYEYIGVATDNSWISQDPNNPSFYVFEFVTESSAGQDDLGGIVEKSGSAWNVDGIAMTDWGCGTIAPASVLSDFGIPACYNP
jgi:hypothetical protein